MINCKDVIFEIEITADSYADAYLRSEKIYPACVIRSISEIREPFKEQEDIPQKKQK